jgi:O-succinylbenzoate synthase
MSIKTATELSQLGPICFKSAELIRVSIPMHEPFRISSGEVSNKEALLLHVFNDSSFGWGESSAMPGAFYSADTPDSCERQLVHLLPQLMKKEYATIGELESYLKDQSLSPFVRVAVETAAWELLARTRGVSLQLLFGMPDSDVPTGLAVGLYPTLDELKVALERYRPLEYSRLKIKIKHGQDIALVQAVREWYGDIPLFVDANADYTEADLDIFLELDAFDLIMFEQPFAKGDIATSAKLQSKVKTPICFDEGIESADDVRRGAALDAMRIVNIKLQRVGGYLEAWRIIEACIESRLPFWMGTMPELGVGSAQALVLATHLSCAFPTDVEPSERWFVGDVLKPELRMSDGKLRMPNAPGLGFEIDPEAIRRFEVNRWKF